MKQVNLLPILLGLLLIFAIVAINLQLPAIVQARPLPGFTPTPEPPAPDDGGDDDPSEPSSSNPDEPTDYVIVQMSQCDMECLEADVERDQPDEKLLVYTFNTITDAPLPVPIFDIAVPIEIIAPVQLLHEGSGFITVGAISTHHGTRFALPYPGRWSVLLTGQLQFVTPEIPDINGTSLPQLQADLAVGPVPLGVVEANVETTQLVKCPIQCLVETSQTIEDPPYLPETGEDRSLLIVIALIIGPVLIALGFTRRLASHARADQGKRTYT